MRVFVRVRRRQGLIIAPELLKQNSGKIETTGSSRAYDTFFMNIGELVERRVAVQEPPRVDKLLTLCTFSCRVSSTHTRDHECFHMRLFGECQ